VKIDSLFSTKGAFIGLPAGKGKKSAWRKAHDAAAKKFKAQFKREGKVAAS